MLGMRTSPRWALCWAGTAQAAFVEIIGEQHVLRVHFTGAYVRRGADDARECSHGVHVLVDLEGTTVTAGQERIAAGIVAHGVASHSQAALCIGSNDPQHPRTVVPVRFDVGDALVTDGFDG
jgi:hypothetical protein